ncbi:LEM-3-like GIY-YIG domain-containing protein [Undibacterium terreum]|nr:hypothetical protein [Undibacterium terreum]
MENTTTAPESAQRNLHDYVQQHYVVPVVGTLPAFKYSDLIKDVSLALNESVLDYVYILRRPDKQHDGVPQPFYVGKGAGRRFAHHFYEAAAEKEYNQSLNKHKIRVIRSVGRENVLVQMIPCHTHEYALALEKKLIAQWGRRAIKTGILTNLTEGGEGVAGLAMPPHVKAILSEMASQPVRFNGNLYTSIKAAFHANEAATISTALRVSKDSKYCTDYNAFKSWYSHRAQLELFPLGFNYMVDEKPFFIETSWSEIDAKKGENISAGYGKAWDTRYPYARYLVNGNAYHTLSDATENEDGTGTPSNLAARFRRMVEQNHFSEGFNILDEQGTKLFKEHDETLQEASKRKSADQLRTLVAEPVMLDSVVYANTLQAYEASPHWRKIAYGSFRSQILRYENAGVFPCGLNIPDAKGQPRYPEIDPFLLGSGPLESYVKVADRFFPSMQAADTFFKLSRGTVHAYFTKWKKDAENEENPQAFPKGFNVYSTRLQAPLYAEMTKVDLRVPVSGYLFDGKVFGTTRAVDIFRGRAKNSSAPLYRKRRKAYLEKNQSFDPLMNVLGWDELPLYPVDLEGKHSTLIARSNGSGTQLHNAARAVEIFDAGIWKRFDSKSSAWRSLPFLQQKYSTADSFISSTTKKALSRGLPAWIRLVL